MIRNLVRLFRALRGLLRQRRCLDSCYPSWASRRLPCTLRRGHAGPHITASYQEHWW